ncbi:unnamed protein product, partial [marine sediment metagenome]
MENSLREKKSSERNKKEISALRNLTKMSKYWSLKEVSLLKKYFPQA